MSKIFSKGVLMVEYQIIYSTRRSIALVVRDGKLIVRAPKGTPLSKIRQTVESHQGWIEKNINAQKEKAERFDGLSEQDIKALKKLAKKVLKAKTEYYAKQVGVSYGRITITSAKTRFGSCSSKGNISYSYRLMLYPESAIDYVVVHELAHRKYMNHQKAFYKEIEKVLPDYKKRKMLLKK